MHSIDIIEKIGALIRAASPLAVEHVKIGFWLHLARMNDGEALHSGTDMLNMFPTWAKAMESLPDTRALIEMPSEVLSIALQMVERGLEAYQMRNRFVGLGLPCHLG